MVFCFVIDVYKIFMAQTVKAPFSINLGLVKRNLSSRIYRIGIKN